MNNSSEHKAIIIWLSFIIVMVFAMVFIGGVTRLTDSGLSMVDWKPIMGAIPPLTQSEWQAAFLKYQAYPEFNKVNFHMNLEDFKQIYFWEYFHRLFGRLIGLVFIIPFLYFSFKKKISKAFGKKVFVAFILGGMQGLMGWYMVKSGLVNRPDVSQYRLSAHLLLAFVIIGYVYFLILQLRNPGRTKVSNKPVSKILILFFTVLILQITYGAFVAGLDAGLTHNTFPKMGRTWIPNDMFTHVPTWINFFENIAAVQFVHRYIGWALIFLGAFIFTKLKKINDVLQKKYVKLILIMLVIQFLLGISTLVLLVPISIASLHQLGAVILFLLTINALYFSFTDEN